MRSLSILLCLTLLSGCSYLQGLVKPTPTPVTATPSAKLAVAAPAAPAVVAPSAVPVAPPISLTVPVGYNLTLSWAAVTTYTNGTPLVNTPDYKIYNYIPTSGVVGFRGYVGNVLSTKILESTAGTFCYEVSVQVYDPNANESARTNPICVLVSGTGPPVPGPPATTSPVCVK